MGELRPVAGTLKGWLSIIHRDVVAALRSLARSRGFVAVAVTSVGFAISVNTTTFALVDAIRRPYVDYAKPDQLHSIGFEAQGKEFISLEHQMYLAFRPRRDLYAAMALVGHVMGSSEIEANGKLVSGGVAIVATNLFDVLGVKPIVGRAFRREGEASTDVAIISYELWHDYLGENRALNELRVSFNGRTLTVVGVMPSGVNYGGDVWLPMPSTMEQTGQGLGPVSAVIRFKRGESFQRVAKQLEALSDQFKAAHLGDGDLFNYRLSRAMDAVKSSVGGFPLSVAILATLMLLVACLNLANLMLARGLGRRREIAVRLALGASRAAIARYVMVECAVVASAGGACGIVLSVWGVKLAQAQMPSRIADLGLVVPHLNWRIVGFGVLVTVATALIGGALPAIRAANANVNEALKDGGSGSTGQRNRSYRLVVVGEIALALFVTMGATYALQVLHRKATFQFGFDAEHQLRASVSSWQSCPPSDSLARLWTGMVSRMVAVPGVRYAAVDMRSLPVRSTITSDQPGTPIQLNLGEGMSLGYDLVTPDFFRVFGYRIIAGRDFVAGDAGASPVAIVNRRLAARLWPFMSPVGRLLKLGPARSTAPWVRVVGVAARRVTDAGDSTSDDAPDLAVLGSPRCGPVQVFARTSTDPQGPAVALYHALRVALPSHVIVTSFASPKAEFTEELRLTRIVALLFGLFAIFTLSLSAIGVYGVLNYIVGRRLREFAVRSALGARPVDVRRLIVVDAMEMVLGGTALGGTVALFVGRGLAGMSSVSALTLASTEGIVIVATLAACIVPMRRAARADPVELLRAS